MWCVHVYMFCTFQYHIRRVFASCCCLQQHLLVSADVLVTDSIHITNEVFISPLLCFIAYVCILHPLPAFSLSLCFTLSRSIQLINNWGQAADWRFNRVVDISLVYTFACAFVWSVFWVWIIRNWNKHKLYANSEKVFSVSWKIKYYRIELKKSLIADTLHFSKNMCACVRVCAKFLSVKRVESKKEKKENVNEMCDNVHSGKVFRRQKKHKKVVKKSKPYRKSIKRPTKHKHTQARMTHWNDGEKNTIQMLFGNELCN